MSGCRHDTSAYPLSETGNFIAVAYLLSPSTTYCLYGTFFCFAPYRSSSSLHRRSHLHRLNRLILPWDVSRLMATPNLGRSANHHLSSLGTRYMLAAFSYIKLQTRKCGEFKSIRTSNPIITGLSTARGGFESFIADMHTFD